MNGSLFAAGAVETWVAAILATLAFLAAAALERRRGGAGGERLVRLLLLAVACLALFLLVARPQREMRLAAAEGVLLTPGATRRDLVAATKAGSPVWAVSGGAGEPLPPAGAAVLPDAAAILRLDRLAAIGREQPATLERVAVRRLRVAGHGLAPWELDELGSLALAAGAPPALPFGIAEASWPRRLALGEVLEVGGRAVGVPPGGATVRLVGAGIDDVSTRLAAGDSGFVLRTSPRGPGRLLLELRLRSPRAEPRVERVDVEVMADRPPALLWLEGAPSAEGRELKRWLAAEGGALTWRAELTRGVWREETVGMPARATTPAARLALDLLRRFDLVIADRRALAALAADERAALAAAVRESGTGLLLRAGDGSAREASALGVAFPLRPAGGAELAARLDWPAGDSPPLALPAREIAPQADLVPLSSDRAGRLLAAWRPLGAGAVGATLVDDTWRWVLGGHAAAHRRYWRETIAALARPAAAPGSWESARGPLLVGLPATLTFTGDPAPGAAVVQAPGGNTLSLPLRQDADEPRRWTTTWWPREPGWHRVGEGPAAAWLWSAPPTGWTTWRLAKRQDATAARLAQPQRTIRVPEGRRMLPLPRWSFFALLLLALSTLWSHEQLLQPTSSPNRP